MKKRKTLLISIVIIVIVFSIGIYYFINNYNDNDNEKIYTVKRGAIIESIEETGEISSKKINTYYSDMSQKVAELNVSIGDRANKGDILLIYDNNLDLEIERTQKQLEVLTATYNEATKGVDFEQVANVKLSINSLEENIDFAKSNFEKTKLLYEQNAISKSEFETAENELNQLENQLEMAYNTYDLLTKDVSNNIKNQYEAQIDEIGLAIQILENTKEDATIIANFDGIITELNVDKGSMTQIGIPVIEIQDDKDLCIYVDLLVEDAINVEKNMDVIINKDDENRLAFKVDKIYPKAVTKISELGIKQKRIRIEIDIPELYKDLIIGSSIDLEIITNEKQNVLMVERDAVYEKDNKKYVILLDNNTEKEAEVITGIKNNEYIEIIRGLKENDKVIIK